MANIVFYVAAIIAVFATAFVIFTRNIVHGLLSLVLSLLSTAMMIFILGAPFAAALEIIIYSGAIMVLFVFAAMILGSGSKVLNQERLWLKTIVWTPPIILAVLLVVQFAVSISTLSPIEDSFVGPKEVGLALFGPYFVATILASMLLLSGLLGAYHLSRREEISPTRRGSR